MIDLYGTHWRELAAIRLSGRPVSKKNSKRIVKMGGRPVPLPSKAYVAWESVAHVEAMAQWREAKCWTAVGAEDEPVWLMITAYWCGQRPDLSNVLCGPEDVLQTAGVLTDDKWVLHHDGSRLYQVATKKEQHSVVRVFVPVTDLDETLRLADAFGSDRKAAKTAREVV